MSIRCLLVMVTSLAVLLPFKAESGSILAPPMPARIGGTVTVDGTQLTQDTDDGYTFKVTKLDGTDYVDFNNVPAEDTDGLNASDWYLIDIPIYDATDQAGGAISGDTAVIHVYYENDGDVYELDVSYPTDGKFTVGQAGSATNMGLVARMPPVAPEAPESPADPEAPESPADPEAPSPAGSPQPPADISEALIQTEEEHNQSPVADEESDQDSNPPVAGGNNISSDDSNPSETGTNEGVETATGSNDNDTQGFPHEIYTLQLSSGEHIGLIVESGGSLIRFETRDPDDIADTPDKPENLIYGLIDIEIAVDNPGDTAYVTVQLPEPAPEGYGWYKYSENIGWYDYSDNVAFSENRDQVTLTLRDGWVGDDDETANGIILDPSGLGSPPPNSAEQSVGSDAEAGGCFIDTAAQGSK